MVVAHCTPLIVVVDLHSSLVLVGSACQPHGVQIIWNDGANDTSVVVMVARGGVAPARAGTVEDALLCTVTVQIAQPNLKIDRQFNIHP